MRKKTMKMMIVAGAVALLLPTAAMADWDQAEVHENQEDHNAMINVWTSTGIHTGGDINGYNMESPVGYDQKGDGSVYLDTDSPFGNGSLAPWNTTPCPIQFADDNDMMYMWDAAMGNCPAQITGEGNTIGQTDKDWKVKDNELYGVILDDLYQSLNETASTNTNEHNQMANKKVDQVLDIIFYRSNTAGEVFGIEGWEADDGTDWFGGLGIDQTLDQDVADIEGTKTLLSGAALWDYNHVAQTFYQDFRLFDLGNTFGPNGAAAETEDQFAHLDSHTNAEKGHDTPRNRHGIMLLAMCSGGGDCSDFDTDEGVVGEAWGDKSMDVEDFAFFDQWVIQSLRDDYTEVYDGSQVAGLQTFHSSVTLEQSYSSWVALGTPGNLCDSVNDDNGSPNPNGKCTYSYNDDQHEVDKSITEDASVHQTGQ